ncbi:DUF1176 domain-containing protein [Klebsiella variicola]|uniref:DUF1176 domain-containing protein n=1 Tax=Klebsiella variicola TaxID=244366 RepID=UPI0007CD3922|nr:DUF1176 domain-containing protein [Klebsiella variicola]MDI9058419.1 DUF1176 domain-containing protein [Klebsiella variicola]SAT42891.1 Protein of uncharacterised function (DUF1176) [Klebsiella variicola]HEN4987571.1 DUF1176 domain-containing protein [Klebsiella variicola subsp. variicola]
MRAFFWAAWLGLCSTPLLAAPLQGFSFAQKDWELACDNTGTCRAAGYGVRMGEVSVLLTRNAGSEQHLAATATFAQIEHDIPADSTASLLIDDRDLGALDAQDDSHFRLDSDQTAALLQALANQRKIEFTLNGQHLPLSSAGSREVLGKMDAFQRRTGTAGALLDKGDAGDDAILPATAAPEIIAAPVIHNAQPVPLSILQRQKLLPSLTPLLNQRCDDWQNPAIPAAERQITLTALDKTHSLVQALCWRAPYNDGYALWLVDNAQLSKPRLLTTEASSYADGAIVFLHKERGMADCVTGETRVWDGKTFTPSLKYSTGMCREITPGGTWMLPTFVSQVIPRQQKEADNLALRTLYNAVLKAQKSDPELSLNKVAEQFPLTGHITDFTLTYADDTLVSTSKPSPDISDDEWQAFLRSSISADSENGKVSFTLIDLDGDGKRDLIIDSYVGGTGLFSYTGVLRRGDNDFAAVDGSDSDNGDDFDAGVPGALFSINGRGANQWNHWVKINGQVYALWYNGQFGEDNLYLLRPFSTASQTPAVTVRYRYTLNSIRSPEKDQPLTPPLSDSDKADLLRSLEVMQGSLLKDKPVSDNDAPICPIPPGTSADEADNYYSGVAINYIYETVAYIPVWLNGKCYIGTIFSHHGAYRHGVDAEITLSSPREDEEVIGDYIISGLRHVIAITSGWKTREGDNGMQ